MMHPDEAIIPDDRCAAAILRSFIAVAERFQSMGRRSLGFPDHSQAAAHQLNSSALRAEGNVVVPELRGGRVNLLTVEAMARRTGAMAMVDRLQARRGFSG